MKALTVEWVFDDRLISEADGFTAKEMAEAGRIPVVRLAELRGRLEAIRNEIVPPTKLNSAATLDRCYDLLSDLLDELKEA